MTTERQSTPTLDRHDDGVFVLDLGDGENRLHPDWVATVDEALTTVEQAEGPRALVTTATGKIYSNGLDLDWVSAHPGEFGSYIESVHRLFARFLTSPVVSVAAIQGHAFAAGAMIALSHDFRVMREDRGFWCLPEVDLGMEFTPGMNALITARLTPQTAHEAMVVGKRYGGAAAREVGIVDRVVPEDEVVTAAMDMARENVGRAGTTLAAIRATIYADAIAVLTPNPS